MEENGGIDMEVRHRVSAAWRNRKKWCVVQQKYACEAKWEVIYRTVVRPVLVYGADTTKSQEKRLMR